MAVPTPEERIGSKLAGKYKILKILGKGGMGIVFAGKHMWTDREVAIKLLRANLAQDTEIAHRFLREARTSAKIKHPHIVDVLDMGRDDDGSVYLVYELLHGEPLGDRIKRGDYLPPEEAVAVLAPVMDALAAAHAAKIVHRDIKPDNIFLADDIGEGMVASGGVKAKLLDFGIAKVIDAKDFQTITGTVMGTPYYMAPEQAKASKDVSPAADVWAMAVVFYHAISGKRPYPGKRPGQVMEKLIKSDPILLSEAAPEVPAAISSCIDRVLVRDPAARPSMAELATSLREAAAELGGGDPIDAIPGASVSHGGVSGVQTMGEGVGYTSEVRESSGRAIPATVQLGAMDAPGGDESSSVGGHSSEVVVADDWDDEQDDWDKPTEAMERPDSFLEEDPGNVISGEEATLAFVGNSVEETGSSRLRAALQTVTTAEAKAEDRRASSASHAAAKKPPTTTPKTPQAAPDATAITPPAKEGGSRGLILGLVALVILLAAALVFVLLRAG